MSNEEDRCLWDIPLTAQEFAQRSEDVAERMSGPEGDEMLELHRWFMRRYPTPLDRLRYIRKQTASVLRAPKKND
jgi:hypothetical protein